MLEKAKNALRLKTSAFDDEIDTLIAACKDDLRAAGVEWIQEGDPLINRAVILYCKAHFGYLENAERYERAYEHLKCTLCLDGEHNAMV